MKNLLENLSDEEIKNVFSALQEKTHRDARQKGWWDELDDLHDDPSHNEHQEQRKKINVGEKIALIHSKLSEALEAYRQPFLLQDKHCPEFTNYAVELADAAIRIFDLAEAHGIPLGNAIIAKVRANQDRPYKHGGKKF